MSEKEFGFSLLREAYELTENVTPKRYDCGRLCDGACCKNASALTSEAGMILLPYEKEFLESIGAAGFTYESDKDGVNYLVCDGSCNRKFRPFACRIFPYYADFSQGYTRIKKDLRAVSVCPMLNKSRFGRANIRFLRNIRKSVRILCKSDLYKDDLIKTSEFINELYYLYKMLK